MLLITDFHSCSLFDFLRELKSPITAKNMVRMAHTVACGLSHLHAEIVGTNAKPSIVHRDLKSKNILVKVDGVTCVIADFGLAIKYVVFLLDSTCLHQWILELTLILMKKSQLHLLCKKLLSDD